MTALDISNGFYQADALRSMNLKCNNRYPKSVRLPSGAVDWRLLPSPGVSQLLTAGASLNTDSNRGLHEIGSNAYAINGNTLYFLDIDATFPTATALGTIAGSGQVSVDDNGTQLMVLVPGVAGYIYDESTSTFSQITDPDFTANGIPQYAWFIDGYFMATTDGQKFIISALRDGLSWNALDFGSAEVDPDPIVGGVNFKNEAYIFGSGTGEVFENVGGSGFPYQRNGLILDKGLTSPLSIVKTLNTFMWIGAGFNEQPAVYALASSRAVKISNTGIDLLIKDLTESEQTEVRGFAYMQDGSYFACWTLPDVTIVYDTREERWHTRTSRVEQDNELIDTAWRCINLIERPNGDLVAGDTISNRIGSVNTNANQEYNDQRVRREFDAIPIDSEQVFACPQIELVTDGNSAGDFEMAISRDAYEFGDWRARTLQGSNNRRSRAKWRRNGRNTDYVQFRFRDITGITVIGVRISSRLGRS